MRCDDEAWFGEFSGIRYALSYERKRQPSAELIDYARTMLADPRRLRESVDAAKAKAAEEHGDPYGAEIASSTLGRLHFYRQECSAWSMTWKEVAIIERGASRN